jgi:uracil-DNA glycosylase family 4
MCISATSSSAAPASLKTGAHATAPPTQDEIQACYSWLDQQLTLIKPLVIVCLGAPAASTLIHKNFKIMQERGLWFSNRYAPAVIAALHPAYILRQAGEAYERAYQSLVDDLTAARERARELRRLQEQMQPLQPEGDDQLRLF